MSARIGISLEALHAYADGPPVRVNEGIHLVSSVCSQITGEYSTCMLIDNYNFPSLGLDWWPNRQDRIPYDFWCLEANLVSYRDALYDLLGDCRLRRREIRYFASSGQHSCSFLTCAWYLVRLGVFDPDAAFENADGEGFVPRKTLVNVLPHETSKTEAIAYRLFLRACGPHAGFDVRNHFY